MFSRQSQAELPSTLMLQSSSTLGTATALTNKDRLQKMEDKEVRQALRGGTGKRKRGGERLDIPEDSHFEDDSDYEQVYPEDDDMVSGMDTTQPGSVAGLTSVSESTTVVGSALRRNADGIAVPTKPSARKIKGNQVGICDIRGSSACSFPCN